MENNMLLLILVFFPMIGAGIAYMIGRKYKKARDYVVRAVVIVEFALAAYMLFPFAAAEGGISTSASVPGFCGLGLFFQTDGFRILYGIIASFMWMMSTLFSKEYFAHYHNRNRYYLFLLLTLGATMGLFFSSDLYTAFIFFEIMSFTSYVWVAQDEKRESLRAAETYLAVAVIGGLVMLMGIFLIYHTMGTLNYNDLYDISVKFKNGMGAAYEARRNTLYIAGACLLFGFGAKAGAFPLHIWLPKAHPVAPAPASALLSGILTKAGIFGILVVSCNLFLHDVRFGTLVLVIGVLTMLTGAVLALFSIDLKRTLACSSVSQIGFILTGIGMQGLLGEENALAIRGTLLHMVNHSLFKLVLFMAAGVVFMNVHKLDLNAVKGFGRKKPLLNFAFLMGALGIGGIPLFSGYISKTFLHESIAEYIEVLHMGNAAEVILSAGAMKTVEWLFVISGGLTVAYMLKLYIAVFIEKNNDGKVQEEYDGLRGTYMNRTSAFAVVTGAVLFPFMGIFPNYVMNRIADFGQGFMHVNEAAEAVRYFSAANLTGAAVSLIIGLFVYFVIVRKWMGKKEEGNIVYVDKWNKYWDLENSIYRPVLLNILPMIFGVICRILDSLVDGIIVFLRKTVYKDSRLPHELEEGTYFTHVAGAGMNHVVHFLNRTLWKRKPKKEIYEHKLALKHQELAEDNTIIGRSMSFGLLLFSAGLIMTLVYLLWN